MCADIYARIWKDDNTQRHGRRGQRQNGIDIIGRPDGKTYWGVQCKNKNIWPPQNLTTVEIDEEVEKAKTFVPPISHFIIATTAPSDQKVQAHARAITERHEKIGLFSVSVASWDEISRLLTQYPDLLLKHYPSDSDLFGWDSRTAEELDRDLDARYRWVLKRSAFPEATKVDELAGLGKIVQKPNYSRSTPSLRRKILLRAARSAAVHKNIENAEEMLRAAQSLAGADSDLIAQARILEAKNDIDTAIALLRDENDADSQSSLFNILLRARGAEACLVWFSDRQLSVPDLTVGGLHTLIVALSTIGDVEKLGVCLEQITTSQLAEGPNFRTIRAAFNVASLLPKLDRELVWGKFLMDVRHGRSSVLGPAATAAKLDSAIDDLTALMPVLEELDLPHAKRITEAYVRWCQLLHPHRAEHGLKLLRAELKNPKLAVHRLSLAFAFDKEFKADPIEDYLHGRESFGGLDDDELKAALIIRLHSDDPASVAALIDKYRARFEADFQDPPIFIIELQALAWAGNTISARQILDQNREKLSDEIAASLENEIAKSEGEDSVAADLKLYEKTKSAEALRVLVKSLVLRKDRRAIARYSEELYKLTDDPADIVRAAQARGTLNEHAEYIRLVGENPLLLDRGAEFIRHYAFALFHDGRLGAARDVIRQLAKKYPNQRDLQLEVAIAIESGEWESLSEPLAAFIEQKAERSGIELLRAAQVSQISGQGRLKDLIEAAVQAAPQDPKILAGAYFIVVGEGMESDLPSYHDWFRRAVALSGKNGPIQKYSLKDLVEQQSDWSKRTREISALINQGKVPLAIAGPALRATLLSLLLGNLIRNSHLKDPRQKYVIPLFSGHRLPVGLGGEAQCIALDISALIVLGWLEMLPKVLEAFAKIVLPATVLSELFDGRRHIQQFQKSRLLQANEIERILSRGRIKIVDPTGRADDKLSKEVGPQFAALICAAEETNGIILRPAPLYRPGLEQLPADISGKYSYLCDMHSLLRFLSENGYVSQSDEEEANKYFELQDEGWPECGGLSRDRPLFIDGLALVYLQYVSLLDAVLEAFNDIRVEKSTWDEISATIDYGQHAADVTRTVESIRSTILRGDKSGKIKFGPRVKGDGKLKQNEEISTFHLLTDLTGIDVLVCDDRAINKEDFATDASKRQVRCRTSLDILEELQERGAIAKSEKFRAYHRLRLGGASLIPLGNSELLLGARRSERAVSIELHSIQQSIDLANFAGLVCFPRDIRWFMNVNLTIKASIFEVWQNATDFGVARKQADLLADMLPDPLDWISRWEHPSLQWARSVEMVIMAGLATPIILNLPKEIEAYHSWIEDRYLSALRSCRPDFYQEVVAHIQHLILRSEDIQHEKVRDAKSKGAKHEKRNGQNSNRLKRRRR